MKTAKLNVHQSRKLRQRLERKYYLKVVKGYQAEESDLDLLGDPP